MDIAIVGTGAIGGYYGVRLALAGHRVHFLAHTEYDAIKANGLRVDSVEGEFELPQPLVYNDPAAIPDVDLVCVAVKATANAAVLPNLPKAPAILLMQNGFGVEPELAKLYPGARIYAGLCFICSFRDGPGVIRHTAYGGVSLASLEPDPEGLAQLAAMFKGAGLPAAVIGDVLAARFRKLIWNIPFNGLTTVLGVTTDKIVGDPVTRGLARRLMEEIVAAAAACEVVIEPEFVDEMIQHTDEMTPYSPSMRLDYLAGRPLEIDVMYRNVIAYAAAHGYDMARTAMLADELEFLSV
ncbi:MAG: 2-dehydropantoate 2-reductase [Propionibacteriaceae bacterium]|jgi:2-dehydropantoate 2-reductase|nr:2-dehydropantoate 2-reductase [Propionibacteriaceae bacterium]